MKKLLVILSVFIAINANAQIQKGDLFVGGSLGFNTSGGSDITVFGGTTTEVEDISSLGFNIMPQVGFMITENIGVGLGVGYDFSQTTIPDFFDNGTDLFDQVLKGGSFSVSPFARYYKNLANKFYLFGELNIPIDFGSQKSLMWNTNFDGVIDNDEINSSISYGLGLGLGANYFLSDMVALEAYFNIFGLSYMTYETTQEEANGDKYVSKSSYFNMNLDSKNLIDIASIRIGLKIFL